MGNGLTHRVVSSHVDAHGQAPVRPYPRTGGVQTQFAHWDAHSIDTQISETQNPLSISHHHSLNYKKNKNKNNQLIKSKKWDTKEKHFTKIFLIVLSSLLKIKLLLD